MGRRGPRPQPTQIKKLRGNPGRRPLNQREPDFSAAAAVAAAPVPAVAPAAVVEAPAFLDGLAREEWDRMAPILSAAKLLTPADRAALAGYCQCWARWVEAERFISEHGTVVQFRDEHGNLKYSQAAPHVGIAIKMLDRMRQFAAEFGMTPAARSRVETPEEPAAADPFAEFGAPDLKLIEGGRRGGRT